jgi:hypothetical protein
MWSFWLEKKGVWFLELHYNTVGLVFIFTKSELHLLSLKSFRLIESYLRLMLNNGYTRSTDAYKWCGWERSERSYSLFWFQKTIFVIYPRLRLTSFDVACDSLWDSKGWSIIFRSVNGSFVVPFMFSANGVCLTVSWKLFLKISIWPVTLVWWWSRPHIRWFSLNHSGFSSIKSMYLQFQWSIDSLSVPNSLSDRYLSAVILFYSLLFQCTLNN